VDGLGVTAVAAAATLTASVAAWASGTAGHARPAAASSRRAAPPPSAAAACERMMRGHPGIGCLHQQMMRGSPGMASASPEIMGARAAGMMGTGPVPGS
jgi:hypothetical protein